MKINKYISRQKIKNKTAEYFKRTINSKCYEEEIQSFLFKHPEVLYPTYIKCFSKFKLGDDFETDFVYLIQGYSGHEYIFIEIERANKKIFTKKGHFSSDFTKAKDQILNWKSWITQNHAYIRDKLPGLFEPKFHLIYGRSNELNMKLRKKLQTEFYSTSMIFSTYDDILKMFQRIKETF